MTSANRQPQDASLPEPAALENMAVLQPPSMNWLSPKFLTPLGAQPMAAHNPQIFAAEPTSEAPSFEPSPFFPDLRSPTRTHPVTVQAKRETNSAPTTDEFEPFEPLQPAAPFDDFSELLDLTPPVAESRSPRESAFSTALPSQPAVTDPAQVQRRPDSANLTPPPAPGDAASPAPTGGAAPLPANIPTLDRVSPPTFTPIPEFTAEPEAIPLKPAPRLTQPPAPAGDAGDVPEVARSPETTPNLTEIADQTAIDVQAAAIAPAETTLVNSQEELTQPTAQVSPYLLNLQQVSLPSPRVQRRVNLQASAPATGEPTAFGNVSQPSESALTSRRINRRIAPVTLDAAIAKNHERLADDLDFEVSPQPSDSDSSTAIESPTVQRQTESAQNDAEAIDDSTVSAALTDSASATVQPQLDSPAAAPPAIQEVAEPEPAAIAPSESVSIQRQTDLSATPPPAIQEAVEPEAIAPSEFDSIQRQTGLVLPASQALPSQTSAVESVPAQAETSEPESLQRQLDLSTPAQAAPAPTPAPPIEVEPAAIAPAEPESLQRQLDLPTQLPKSPSPSTEAAAVEPETTIALESLPLQDSPVEASSPGLDDVSHSSSEGAIARVPEVATPVNESSATNEVDAVMVLGESTLPPPTSSPSPTFPSPPSAAPESKPPSGSAFSAPAEREDSPVMPPTVQARLEPGLETAPTRSNTEGQATSDLLPTEARPPAVAEFPVAVEPDAIAPGLPSIQPRLTPSEAPESVEPSQPASVDSPVSGEQRDFPVLPTVLTNLSTLRPLGNTQPLVQRAEQPSAKETQVEPPTSLESLPAQGFDLPAENFDISAADFADVTPASRPKLPAIAATPNGSIPLPPPAGDRPSTQQPSLPQLQAKLEQTPANQMALEPAVDPPTVPPDEPDAPAQLPTDADLPELAPLASPDPPIARSPLAPPSNDLAPPASVPPIQRQTVTPAVTDSVSPPLSAEAEEPLISAADVAVLDTRAPGQENAIAPTPIQPRLESSTTSIRVDSSALASPTLPASAPTRPTPQPNHPTETPTAWSDIADLLTQTSLTVQRRTLPEPPPTEPEPATSPPPVPAVAPPISIAPAPTATPAETTPTAPGEAPSEVVEISGKSSTQPEESDNLERLAREIYHLLRQRLEIERERSGHYYRDRPY